MSSSAGWYPDPGGQPGMYRYWTGTSWTESVTPNPQGASSPDAAASGTGSPAGFGAGSSSGYGTGSASGYGTGSASGYPAGGYPPKRRGNVGWWLVGLAALVAVVVAVVFIVRGMGGGSVIPGLPDPNPTSSVTPDICPPPATSSALPTNDPVTGVITGGQLSYPALGEPWMTTYDNRVPFGSLAMMQYVTDQANYDGENHSWMSSVLLSDLYVGDGFASTKIAAETVLKCVLGTYYADTVVTQQPISSGKHDIAGHSGWLIETQLGFDIPGLNAKGERVLLLVVQTDLDSYSLFYASVPDTSSSLLPDARKAMASLKVG